jgi:hypothetical protein
MIDYLPKYEQRMHNTSGHIYAPAGSGRKTAPILWLTPSSLNNPALYTCCHAMMEAANERC